MVSVIGERVGIERWRWIALAALFGIGAGVAVAGAADRGLRSAPVARASIATIAQLRDNRAAFNLYMLHCGGCHRANGQGAPDFGVPSFVDSAGMFTWLPAGRQYLVRVPGSAFSYLTDRQLAEVLNWIVATYSAKELPPDFNPYTSMEIAVDRARHYKDVAAARARIDKELRAIGLVPSRYTFGRGDAAAGSGGK